MNERRKFFKKVAFATSVLSIASADASIGKNEAKASLIDLSLCDGCKDYSMPLCVAGCREKNLQNYPNPIKEIPDYYPKKIKEDFSNNKDDIGKLTPYNWIFIQHIKVGDQEIFIPRRCMHCDDASCQKVCPFGVIKKFSDGAVRIDEKYCFGGAKCRDMCPWGIPQRQAGVGIYLKLAPKFAGGGVMYKCDMCHDMLIKGQKPMCEQRCPKQAIIFDDREKIYHLAHEKVKRQGGYIYGDIQNGGTSTLYYSKIPFEKINLALEEKYQNKKGTPHMQVEVENKVLSQEKLIKSVLAAPFMGAIAGIIAVKRSKDEQDS